MVPETVDTALLVGELGHDHVAIDPAMNPDIAAAMESGLKDVIAYADAQGFGSLGFVAFDTDPGQFADARDIAQVLADESGLDTVIVRSPGNGAIVSDIYSRAAIESAQQTFFATADYPQATRVFVDEVQAGQSNTATGQGVIIALVLAAAIAAAVTVAVVRRFKAPGV